jgi:hypothetical protein
MLKEGPMLFHGIRALPYRFRLLLSSLQLSGSLPFVDVLSQEQIQAICDRHGVSFAHEDRDAVFTPAITIWGFLSQVIHKGEQRSCLAAVARIGVLLISLGRAGCAQNSGPYCRARSKLPLGVMRDLTTLVANNAQRVAQRKWLWFGRHVKAVDGTTVTIPDTVENQEAYPQQSCQQVGLGFPIARLLGVLSVATGMLHELGIAPYQGKGTGETSLLRQIMSCFQAGEIALMDKLFANFWTLADFVRCQVDVVTLLNETRQIDLSQAIRLRKTDYLISIRRPQPCPSWLDRKAYQEAPETLTLRLIKAQVGKAGYRVRELQILTTLIDYQAYPSDEVAALYLKRWQVELDIRAIKSSMGMNDLRCLTPQMVQKEIWTCLLAYNLIRLKLLESAMAKGKCPLTLSFANGLQLLAATWTVGPLINDALSERLTGIFLEGCANQTVGDRPGRVEPRAVKRRPKPTPLLTMPRQDARTQLLAGVILYQKQK